MNCNWKFGWNWPCRMVENVTMVTHLDSSPVTQVASLMTCENVKRLATGDWWLVTSLGLVPVDSKTAMLFKKCSQINWFHSSWFNKCRHLRYNCSTVKRTWSWTRLGTAEVIAWCKTGCRWTEICSHLRLWHHKSHKLERTDNARKQSGQGYLMLKV